MTGEVQFHSLLVDLFSAGAIPAGSLLEAGSFDGMDALCFAALAPERRVHAIDPVLSNIVRLRRRMALLGDAAQSKVVLHHAALGGRSARVSVGHVAGGMAADLQLNPQLNVTVAKSSHESVDVSRIDDLFHSRWPEETLGFAALDVRPLQ